MRNQLTIRNARPDDLSQIVEIYNLAIDSRKAIAVTKRVTFEERTQWFKDHPYDSYPILVAENNNIIAGWTSLSPYRQGRDALLGTVEVSYFIHNNNKRQGIGNILLQHIQTIARELGYRVMYAVVLHENTDSIKLLEKNNFQQWGLLPDVARIDKILFSHLYYGKKL